MCPCWGGTPQGLRISRSVPPPPWGGGVGGGARAEGHRCKLARPPPPTPPHKGEGRSLRHRRANLTPVGATLVVVRFAHRVCRQQGDHKGRPYSSLGHDARRTRMDKTLRNGKAGARRSLRRQFLRDVVTSGAWLVAASLPAGAQEKAE